MQRVVILGPVGSGKSMLAGEIARRTGLPVVHLDLFFWRAGWTPAPRREARERLAQAVRGDRWILDGNFLAESNGGWDARFERADTVIFLDFSRSTCLRRVVKRVLRRRGRRSDLPEGCTEGIDRATLRWIWSYPSEERPRVVRILERLHEDVAVHHLRSARDVRQFLAGL